MRFVVVIFSACLLLGCEREHNDMGAQDKYNAYQPSESFADGASARPIVPGTIARDTDETSSDKIPFQITSDAIDRGREQFEIYCSVCHGRLGNGQGMIPQRGLTRPPSFHIDRLRAAADTHFYDVISRGFGQMFSYGDQISPVRRWEIVAYIRALQSAGASAPPDVRKQLIAAGDRATEPGHLR